MGVVAPIIDARLPIEKRTDVYAGTTVPRHIVSPAEIITGDPGFMRGHGTYTDGDNLVASTAGIVDKVNKLICVRPLKTRYNGEIGDVVVGRISQVAQRRWKVETNSRLDSLLMLSAVNLPGNVLRRRTADDELLMRKYFVEGDLIAAEVQSIAHSDGALSLHRVKFGVKLNQGTFLKVQSALIKRTKSHYHNLPCGVFVVLGVNGYVWISTPAEEMNGESKQSDKEITIEQRKNIARVRNAINALNSQFLSIYDTAIVLTYEASLKYSLNETLKPEIQEEITLEARSYVQ